MEATFSGWSHVFTCSSAFHGSLRAGTTQRWLLLGQPPEAARHSHAALPLAAPGKLQGEGKCDVLVVGGLPPGSQPLCYPPAWSCPPVVTAVAPATGTPLEPLGFVMRLIDGGVTGGTAAVRMMWTPMPQLRQCLAERGDAVMASASYIGGISAAIAGDWSVRSSCLREG